MKQIKARLAKLIAEHSELLKKMDEKKANLRFRCGCGRTHRIKDCVAIQTHWYTSPSGCTGGDYWNIGEMQIICPVTDVKNRCMFNNYDVDWTKRDDYAYNAEKQFRSQYKGLFKEVIDDYDKDKRGWWNNFYFDDNHKKFNLYVEGRDYKTYGKKI